MEFQTTSVLCIISIMFHFVNCHVNTHFNFFVVANNNRQGVKLLVSVDVSTRAPWIMLNEQHIMACTSTM
jgi:hypothetical protein